MKSITKNNQSNTIKQGGAGYLIFQIIVSLLLILFAFMCIYPFWYIIIYALSDPAQVGYGVTLLPRGFSLRHFQMVLEMPEVYQAFFISASRAFVGTVITLFFSSMFAFVLTKQILPYRLVIYRVMVISMYLSAGLIPWFLTMNFYRLNNTFFLYVIPSAVGAFYVILIKTFMESLPEALEEAAMLDGANYFQIFIMIILPVCKPILATVAVFSAVGQWNSWTDNFFLVSDSRLFTLQYMLYNLLNQAEAIAAQLRSGRIGSSMREFIQIISPMSIRMATTVVTILPILFVYPLLQRYFVKGLILGAIKA